VARGDLMQRTLLVELPVIPADQRREESDFWSAFETSRPRLCGALLDAVAAGLREVSRVRLVSLPRMADFAKWSVAVERGLDWEPGFLTAYMQNIDTAHEAVLDGSPVAAAVRTLVDGAGSFWTGTATDLLTRLTGQADETLRRGRAWPKTPRGLSGALRRVAPNLREVGLHVTFDREPGGNRRRTVTIEYRDSSVPTVPPVPDGTVETSRDGRDAKIPPLDVADALPSWATEEDGEL
jgi:hypothetical protein